MKKIQIITIIIIKQKVVLLLVMAVRLNIRWYTVSIHLPRVLSKPLLTKLHPTVSVAVKFTTIHSSFTAFIPTHYFAYMREFQFIITLHPIQGLLQSLVGHSYSVPTCRTPTSTNVENRYVHWFQCNGWRKLGMQWSQDGRAQDLVWKTQSNK